MAQSVYRVELQGDEWLVSRMGEYATKLISFSKKEDAVAGGRMLALRRVPSKLIVHRENGAVETEFRFGKD